jgi:hypothetical protein
LKDLNRAFFLVYEFVDGAQPLPEFLINNYVTKKSSTIINDNDNHSTTTKTTSVNPPPPPPPAMPNNARKSLFNAIGGVAIVDMLIHNTDRFPLHCINDVSFLIYSFYVSNLKKKTTQNREI